MTAEYSLNMVIYTTFQPPGIDSALSLVEPIVRPQLGDGLEIVNMGLAIGRDRVSTVGSPWGVHRGVCNLQLL